MPRARHYLLALIVCLIQFSYAQPANKPTGRQRSYGIPFQLTSDNNMAVQAVLNDKDTVSLMFHTAASSVSLTEDATGRLKTLTFDGTDSARSWGGKGNVSRFSKSNKLQLGTFTWDKVPLWENKNSGPGTDGKFGTDLFTGMIVEIDFEKRMIFLHTSLPRKVKKFEKLPLSVKDDMLFVEAICVTKTNTLKNKFLLHSGYAGDVLLDDQFVAANQLGEQLTIIGEKVLKDSFGNRIRTSKAILPEFAIGNMVLRDVPTGFFEGALGRQKMSIIGGDLLKRFNILIDAKREFIYLKANKLNPTAFYGS